jgi:5-methylcytosine-specific restriction endonuclease McrA
MTTYKVIVTVAWQMQSDEHHAACLEQARAQLDKILNSKPQGFEYDGFTVQVDLAKMKDRKRLIHLGDFDLDDVFPFVTVEESKREYKVGDKVYTVRMNSDRYHVFKANHKCVSCGLAGSKMILDMNSGDSSPHFNMYAEENGRLVLMTKDHKLAKSKGGTDDLGNFVNCCSVCNNLKGAYNLTYAQVKELRKLYDNQAKLTRKELRTLINKTREEMASQNDTKEEI